MLCGHFIKAVQPGVHLILHTDRELALLDHYCVSGRLREESFEFRFPDLKSALQYMFSPGDSKKSVGGPKRCL